MEMFDCKHNTSCVEADSRFIKTSSAAQVEEHLASRTVLEDEIEFSGVLESIFELHDERVADPLEDTSFSASMLDLVALGNEVLAQDLHC